MAAAQFQPDYISLLESDDPPNTTTTDHDVIVIPDSSSDAAFGSDADFLELFGGDGGLPNHSRDDISLDESLRLPHPLQGHRALLQDETFAEHIRQQEQLVGSPQASLQQIVEVFPDISHEFASKIYQEKYAATREGPAAFNATIDYMIGLDNKYPKQKDTKDNSVAEDPAESSEKHSTLDKVRLAAAKQILALEFPALTMKTIYDSLKEKTNVYDAYLSLAEVLQTSSATAGGYNRLKRPRSVETLKAIEPLAGNGALMAEIRRAKIARAKIDSERRLKTQEEERERENEREAMAKGEMGECQCCFSEVPLNRMVHCGGSHPHLFCFDCLITLTETGFGQGKSRPICMDQSGCKAEFMDHQLRLCLTEASMSRLLRLQQQESLKAAGIEGLEECPFCDFLDVCPPVDSDKEFRCKMMDCMKISCRMCREETHIPLTCEEAKDKRAKERAIDARHFLEEAMTAAMVRECNKCKNRFVKIEGCNKMSCTKCGNRQCYICSADVKDYSHFSQRPGDNKCPAHDEFTVDRRHHDEVKKAEEEARLRIQAETPGINPEHLAIKVSEAVLREEEQKIKRRQYAPPHPGLLYVPPYRANPNGGQAARPGMERRRVDVPDEAQQHRNPMHRPNEVPPGPQFNQPGLHPGLQAGHEVLPTRGQRHPALQEQWQHQAPRQGGQEDHLRQTREMQQHEIALWQQLRDMRARYQPQNPQTGGNDLPRVQPQPAPRATFGAHTMRPNLDFNFGLGAGPEFGQLGFDLGRGQGYPFQQATRATEVMYPDYRPFNYHHFGQQRTTNLNSDSSGNPQIPNLGLFNPLPTVNLDRFEHAVQGDRARPSQMQ